MAQLNSITSYHEMTVYPQKELTLICILFSYLPPSILLLIIPTTSCLSYIKFRALIQAKNIKKIDKNMKTPNFYAVGVDKIVQSLQ